MKILERIRSFFSSEAGEEREYGVGQLLGGSTAKAATADDPRREESGEPPAPLEEEVRPPLRQDPATE